MPEEIGALLLGHEVAHVGKIGWQALSNGVLLATAEEAGFDVLITKDANMPFQQNFSGRRICVLVLRPRTQDRDDLLALAPQALQILPVVQPGTVVRVPPL